MLPIGVKLNHIVIVTVNSVASGGLKTNCEPTIDRHINDIAANILANGKRAIMGPVINDNKIELRRNLP